MKNEKSHIFDSDDQFFGPSMGRCHRLAPSGTVRLCLAEDWPGSGSVLGLAAMHWPKIRVSLSKSTVISQPQPITTLSDEKLPRSQNLGLRPEDEFPPIWLKPLPLARIGRCPLYLGTAAV